MDAPAEMLFRRRQTPRNKLPVYDATREIYEIVSCVYTHHTYIHIFFMYIMYVQCLLFTYVYV